MEQCQEAISRLLQAEAELSRPEAISGLVRITAPVDLSKRWLARTLSAFAERHPAVRIEVVVTDEILDLLTNHIDLALRGGAPGNPGLVARKLQEEELALHASPLYVKKKLRTPALSSLSGHVVFDPARRGGAMLAGALRSSLETRNFELAKAFALESRGIALLPTSMTQDEIRARRLVTLKFDHPMPTLPLYLVMPTRLHVPARVRALADFLVAAETAPCSTRP